MEKLFKLKANGTSVKTEIAAGLTTFMTMAYIIALNPNLLTNFRSAWPSGPTSPSALPPAWASTASSHWS